MKLLALIIGIILGFLAICLLTSAVFAWLTIEKFKRDEE
nr:MAG TPA: Mid2 like cell wall stress sensor [Caudoviricetes sp.]